MMYHMVPEFVRSLREGRPSERMGNSARAFYNAVCSGKSTPAMENSNKDHMAPRTAARPAAIPLAASPLQLSPNTLAKPQEQLTRKLLLLSRLCATHLEQQAESLIMTQHELSVQLVTDTRVEMSHTRVSNHLISTDFAECLHDNNSYTVTKHKVAKHKYVVHQKRIESTTFQVCVAPLKAC